MAHILRFFPLLLQCTTPYAVIHGSVLLMMGIMMPETCWDRCLLINIRLVAFCWFISLHPTFHDVRSQHPKRRYYLKYVVEKKYNQILLLQAESGEEFSNVPFQLPSKQLDRVSGTEICHRALSLPTTLWRHCPCYVNRKRIYVSRHDGRDSLAKPRVIRKRRESMRGNFISQEANHGEPQTETDASWRVEEHPHHPLHSHVTSTRYLAKGTGKCVLTPN